MEQKYFWIVSLIVIFYVIIAITNPKLDWNYTTGERILWITNPLDGERLPIILYVDRSKTDKKE